MIDEADRDGDGEACRVGFSLGFRGVGFGVEGLVKLYGGFHFLLHYPYTTLCLYIYINTYVKKELHLRFRSGCWTVFSNVLGWPDASENLSLLSRMPREARPYTH